MLHDLIIIHRRGSELFSTEEIEAGNWLPWQTCLRKILIGHSQFSKYPEILANDEVIEGKAAYQFLLEVVCGLHSPMLGETEVFGQFKQLADRHECAELVWGRKLERIFQLLITDGKDVRRKYLTGLGSMSYGSLARRKVQEDQPVHIIGSGIFVKDLLPWFLKKSSKVVIHCRHPEKAHKMMQNLPCETGGVEVRPLRQVSSKELTGVCIVAAPVPSKEISSWLGKSQLHRVLDLRGESGSDPLNISVPVSPLGHFFKEIEQCRTKGVQKVEMARKRISGLTKEKYFSTQFRPFGWDDICASK